MTCDVTPHHLALTDEWLAGARRWAWDASGDPWADERARRRRRTRRRCGSIRRSGRRRMPAACLAALLDGTADAVATDHAPHSEVDKAVEFGPAANGISGIETALGLLLAAVDAGWIAAAASDRSPDDGAGARCSATDRARGFGPGLVEGAPADLVVFDRGERWTVTPEMLLSRGKNSPLLGMELPGRVLVTMAAGRLAYEAPEA